MKKVVWLTVFFFIISSGMAYALNIGNWSGSNRSWNSGEFTIIKSTMIGAGNTVESDEAMTAGNLSNDNIFVIGEAGSTPTAGELSALGSWVTGGGILLLFADSGSSGLPGDNNILSGIGSALSYSGAGASSVTPFPSGIFATTGPPYDLVGQTLDTTPGMAVIGGTTLAGDYIHYDALGLGYIFAFGDRSDHNYFNPTNADVNGQFFLNIAAGSAPVSTPEPVTMLLLGFGLVGLAGARRKF
jgi:hypothetical protein